MKPSGPIFPHRSGQFLLALSACLLFFPLQGCWLFRSEPALQQQEPASSAALIHLKAAFVGNGYACGQTLAEKEQETFYISRDGHTMDVHVWNFSDNHQAIKTWDARVEQEGKLGYGVQSQNSWDLGSNILYRAPDTDQFAYFLLNSMNTVMIQINQIPASQLSQIKTVLVQAGYLKD